MKDGFGQEAILQPIEGILAGIVPVPWGVFLGYIEEGVSDVGVVTNELSVEIGKPKKRANVFYLGQGGPVSDPIEFGGVHFDVPWG